MGMPTADSERIVALDVLRGFALYGVFLTNAFVSSRPIVEALTPPATGMGISETFAWLVFDGLMVMKFVSLFSLLFGIGLVLQCQRAEEKKSPIAGIYTRRLGLLAIMGILHGCLLFAGDILFVYACTGCLLFLFRKCSAGILFSMALVPLVIGISLTLGWIVLGFDQWPTEPDAFEQRAEAARRTGGLIEVLAIRRWEYLMWLVISSVSSFNWRVVSLFFLGAAIMKKGWIQPRYHSLHKRAAWFGLVVGGGLEVGAAAVVLLADQPSVAARLALGISDEIGSLVLSAGYAGAILWMVNSGRLEMVQRGLAAVGRTALSNYILQSVLMNLIFMAFGLGMYEKLSRAEVLGWISVVFCVQIFASAVWLRAFRQGPLEWAWRKLTYLK